MLGRFSIENIKLHRFLKNDRLGMFSLADYLAAVLSAKNIRQFADVFLTENENIFGKNVILDLI